ncbi:MAG: AhpC/TSA family protein [Alphaproteobacteria bacterium]|nr:AhpC/TSA family protein [Alphaproteobacteria bacterium]
MDLARTLETLRDHHMAAIDDFARQAFEEELDRLRMLRLTDESLGVGDMLPDFELGDGAGTVWRSMDLLDRGPLVLAFFRGGWCPYCEITMAALNEARQSIEALGAAAVAISPELPEHVAATVKSRGLTYPLLSDPTNAYARLCGVAYELSPDHIKVHRDRKRSLPAMHGDSKWRLPVPAVYVIEPSGRVVYAFADVDPARWADPKDLLDALRRLAR